MLVAFGAAHGLRCHASGIVLGIVLPARSSRKWLIRQRVGGKGSIPFTRSSNTRGGVPGGASPFPLRRSARRGGPGRVAQR